MADPEKNTATRFDSKVGAKVVVELLGVGGRFNTTFLGWDQDRYVMVKVPPQQALSEQVYIDKPVVVRYLHKGGEVHGFRSRIQNIAHAPHRILFLAYPPRVEKVALRRKERVDCFMQAEAEFGDVRASGYVLNISSGGCRFSAPRGKYGLKDVFRPEQPVSLVFTIPIGEQAPIHASGRIKKLFDDPERRVAGIEFTDTPEAAGSLIRDYVREVREYLRPAPKKQA